MNGVCLLLAVATLGVDHTWRTTQEGQLEYVLQIEPTFVQALAEGQVITSRLPPTGDRPHRICLRIGAADLKKISKATPEWKELASPAAGKAAPRQLVEGDISVIANPQGEHAVTYEISHGWEPANDEQTHYLVQFSPQLLESLREGDEIYTNVSAEAGSIHQFVISSGQRALPREAAKALVVASTPAAEVPAAGAGVYAAGGEGAVAADNSGAEPPRFQQLPRQWNVGDAAADPSSEYQTDQPGTTLEPPPSRELDIPSFDLSTFPSAKSQPARTSSSGFSETRENSPRHQTGSEGTASLKRPRLGAPTRDVSNVTAAEYAPNDEDERVAAVDNGTKRSATKPGLTKTSTRSGTESSSDDAKPWWPLFFTCCALFLSIGGNLYLGWTAAEFYSRYRMAVERMRGAGR